DGSPQTPVDLSGGTATLSGIALTAGTHTVSASYAGTANFKASDTATPLTTTVDKANSATQLASSANPSVTGAPVTFAATITAVAPGAGAPPGSVLFTVDGTAQAPVPISAGQATLTVNSFEAGPHTVTATYNGDVNFQGSTGNTVTQQVNAAATTTAL